MKPEELAKEAAEHHRRAHAAAMAVCEKVQLRGQTPTLEEARALAEAYHDHRLRAEENAELAAAALQGHGRRRVDAQLLLALQLTVVAYRNACRNAAIGLRAIAASLPKKGRPLVLEWAKVLGEYGAHQYRWEGEGSE